MGGLLCFGGRSPEGGGGTAVQNGDLDKALFEIVYTCKHYVDDSGKTLIAHSSGGSSSSNSSRYGLWPFSADGSNDVHT